MGFPGETDEDFDLLLDFIEAAELDRVGCFQYSAVSGAAANELPGAVPESDKQARWDEFMQCQQGISRERLARHVGQRLEVLVDDIDEDGIVARSYADAPEIDGVVHITGAESAQLSVGDLRQVRIEHADDYDLFANLDE